MKRLHVKAPEVIATGGAEAQRPPRHRQRRSPGSGIIRWLLHNTTRERQARMDAREIIWELIKLATHPSHITLAYRGSGPYYVRVRGTNAASTDYKVQIELHNGAVTFRQELVDHFKGAQERPLDQSILKHPLGTSAGPNTPLTHGVTPDDLDRYYGTPQAVAEAIRDALRKVDGWSSSKDAK